MCSQTVVRLKQLVDGRCGVTIRLPSFACNDWQIFAFSTTLKSYHANVQGAANKRLMYSSMSPSKHFYAAHRAPDHLSFTLGKHARSSLLYKGKPDIGGIAHGARVSAGLSIPGVAVIVEEGVRGP